MLYPNQESLINIPTPPTPHAFLITPVMVHDPGKGDLMDLELPDRSYLRAQASPDVLRLGSPTSGLWKATLHFDTQTNARLKEPLRLPRLTPLLSDEERLMPTWGAIGQVVTLDRVKGLVAIRIVTQGNPSQAFTVTAIATLEQILSVEHASYLRLKGSLRDRHLLVTQLESIEAPEPIARKDVMPYVNHRESDTLETTLDAGSAKSQPIRSSRPEGTGDLK